MSAKADAIQTSRIDSKKDNCILIKGLAYSAGGANRQAAVEKYIKHTPLVNCTKYAHEGVDIPIQKGKI